MIDLFLALPRERDFASRINVRRDSLGKHNPIDFQGVFISPPKPSRRLSRACMMLPLVMAFATAATPAAAGDLAGEFVSFLVTMFITVAALGGTLSAIYFASEAHWTRRAMEKRRTSPEYYAEETMRMRAIAGHLHAETELDEAKLRRALKQEELKEVESVLRKGNARIGQLGKR